ncbi:PH domain-containing protein [Rubrivirga sp.]|uniref:PH domain-containing protein n=1 Tax=Rubrivirga sp. TaxID=1885344 RepID=UPI003C74A599
MFGLLTGSFLWLLLSTKYTVDDNTLVVQSGPFKWQIPKDEITGIAPSNSMLSSPALSLDRFRITYARGRSHLLVSPSDKAGFIEALGITLNVT